MKLIGTAPCNIYYTKETIRFTAPESAPPRVVCAVRDYDGKEVWQGEVRDGALEIPPQEPGYYEIEWQAGERRGKTSFGVVPARPDKAPPDGPLAVDGATAWLVGPEAWKPIAHMLRRIGIGWMRERLSWGGVAPEEGTLNWGRYQTVADTLSQQGIRVYQIFHDSPGWTHPGKQTRNPDDLRHVYRFAKEAAHHFAGKILAWEPWNEPDIGFFDQLGDRYAGIQKAAYLGFKAGNPDVTVLLCSLCRGHSAFSDNIFECGVADYMDVFNFHTYSPLSRYVATIRHWIELAKTYGVGERPIWLTEAGIRLEHVNRELTPERERIQAEFVPRSFAISLAGGVDKHFFFVLPFYPENVIQFGALHKDLSPRPALVAIATGVRLLGEARFLGKLQAAPETVQVYVFDNGQGRVAVVWADEPIEARLPVAADEVTVLDLIGRSRQVKAREEAVSLSIGPAAQYLVGLGQEIEARLTGPVRSPGELPQINPSKVVIVGHLDGAKLDKDANSYDVTAGRELPFTVDVYNFNENEPTQGRIAIEPPTDWKVDRTEAEVQLAPMDRQSITFTLTASAAGALSEKPLKIRVRGQFPGPQVAPSVSYVRIDLTTTEPTGRQALNLNKPENWTPNASGNGRMSIEAGDEGGVRFPITFHAQGDRWCYPGADFGDIQDWTKYQALAFEYRFDTEDPGTSVRVQVIEDGGSSYLCAPRPARKDWTRMVAPFNRMAWGSFSPKDPNGRLDLDQVACVLIGCNTKLDKLTLEVRNVELLAFE